MPVLSEPPLRIGLNKGGLLDYPWASWLNDLFRLVGPASVKYQDWTPVFTGLTEVGGPAVMTGKWARNRNIVVFTAEINTTGTTESILATTYISNLPVTSAFPAVAGVANITTRAGMGQGVIASATTRLYAPAWAATADSIVISGAYLIAD